MNEEDRLRFQANFEWFNRFFDDLRQIMETISSMLVEQLGLVTEDKNWYYAKANYTPSIPPYYVTALGNDRFAVQIFAVLDIAMLEFQPAFRNEPSLIIVKHSDPKSVLFLENYGVRVFSNKQISQTGVNDKVISGEILAGPGKGTQYSAFQVLLEQFSAGRDIRVAVQSEIINVLKEL